MYHECDTTMYQTLCEIVLLFIFCEITSTMDASNMESKHGQDFLGTVFVEPVSFYKNKDLCLSVIFL